MANLPNKNCLCNYNARDYNPATGTIPKTTGQLFNEDLVLSSPVTAYTDASISIDGQYMDYDFGSAANNPFNRTGQDPFTIVAKISKGLDNSGEHAIFSSRNRYGGINYILFNPANGADNSIVYLHNDNRYYRDCPYVELDAEPNIFTIRIDQGMGYGQSITDGVDFRSIANSYGGSVSRIGFFKDSYGTDDFEGWRGEFYWLYISNVALTDGEIEQVIAFNEGSPLKVSPTALTATYEASSSAITLTNEDPQMTWTATTIPSFISLSETAGTGTSSITVSFLKNNGAQRSGTIIFEDEDGDIAEVECLQEKHPLLVPYNNIYRNGDVIE